ncbi:MAG: hypothetical protein BWY38_02972 [Ignavibacteria bacterium ADurb.Bin266]|nr:MAG: hypothetical protein BWY38_02972 [Ignavibacteria bacterium ADurb.Bin266]
MNIRLSKTKYLNGLQCKKLLWYIYNEPDAIPEPDATTQAIFDQGHLVGEYAKKLFPNGVEVDHSETFEAGLRQTRDLISKRVSIFEAALTYKRCYARADILEPVADDNWDLIEVKSSTDLKDVNYHDIGFQYYLYTGAGLKIDKCYLMCIDNSYVRKGDIEPCKLLKKIDVTDEIKTSYSTMVENNVAEMVKAINSKTFPQIDIGAHCNEPYDCPLIDKCWSFLPERNVFFLYRNNKLPMTLIQEGVFELDKIPEKYEISAKNQIQVDCEKTGKPYIDSQKIKEFLDTIQYPAYYMDFETFASAIPMFDNSSPYKQIPFQFSVHVVKEKGTKPEHFSFLADGTDDPRPEFMAKLKNVMGTKGSVIAFKASFEMYILNKCAEVLPEYQQWVDSIDERIIDLLQPFSDFAYYHPQQDGSCSLKKVLPALTGKSYDDMEIGDGGTASAEYCRVTFTEDNKDKKKVRKLLEEYCGLDTMGMVDIVEQLYSFK